jgi:multicomponent Na+:H+ antiporter subunit A
MPDPGLIILVALACVPLLVAAVAVAPRAAGWIAAAVPALLFVGFLAAAPAPGEQALGALPWLPSLGVALAWRLDGLSLLFALLITGIGALIFLYAGAYLRGHPQIDRFFGAIALFMAAMLGAVLADDLVMLVVFWELTSLSSFLLIGFEGGRSSARRAAVQGLLVTVGGGLALLAGALLLGGIAGTYRISEIAARAAEFAAHPWAPLVVALIVVGAFAKSAQAPLHSWLPNAMAAPTPVSAYLHSATMVKLGVYLLARLNPVFGGMPLWVELLTGFGALTMVVGAVLALRETDLKRVLAYSTVVGLGTLVALIGQEDPLAATAAIAFLIVHALYKACLFLVAGIVDHETGMRDASRLRGLARAMPLTATVAALGALSMAGLPPFVGFVAKELLYEANLLAAGMLPAAALVANTVTVIAAGVVAARPFFGRPAPTPRPAHDPGFAMLAGPALLAALGLLFGLLPGLLGRVLVEPAAAAILGRPTEAKLVLWHGFTVVFWLSVATIGAGLAGYLAWHRMQPLLAGVELFDRYGPDAQYGRALRGLQRLAAWQTRAIQSGSLRRYLALSFLALMLPVGAAMVAGDGLRWPGLDPLPLAHEVGLVALVAAGALVACLARNLITAIMGVALVGFGAGVLFLVLGAPDLAFTQFSVETLAVVLLVAVLARLPFRGTDPRSRGQRVADAGIALLTGVVGGAVLLAALAMPFDTTIPTWMGENAAPAAHGRNVVNVIIVDFRALDTLGEITVLGLAALAAYAVLRRREVRRP